MSYQLKPDAANEIQILHRDGKPLFCPFKPSLIVPGRIEGQAHIQREPCGTWCPHFQIVENKTFATAHKGIEVSIFCGQGGSFPIEEQQNTKLVSL